MKEQFDKNQYQLPNGMKIFHVNAYETDFVYNEIFNNEVYFQFGIHLKEKAVVFDVGANIGLFSLYVKTKIPSCRIYAFEPLPSIYPILKRNLQKFSDAVSTYQSGLSDCEDEKTLIYYPGYSVISGYSTDAKRDADIIISGMKASEEKSLSQKISNERALEIERLVKSRLATSCSYASKMTMLSSFIEKNNIERIDLLKIDAEGSELPILLGIYDKDWPVIQQIVMEVHKKKDLEIILPLLKEKSYSVHVEADKMLKNSEIYNLYARKKNL